MSFSRMVVSVSILAAFVAACSSSSASPSPGDGSGTGEDSFSCSCCINGTDYSCPDETSCNNCSAPNLDASGCTETGTEPSGSCG